MSLQTSGRVAGTSRVPSSPCPRQARAVKEISDAGEWAVAVVAPVGDTEAAQTLVATAVEGFGRLDVMVTNAGILRDKVLWKMTDHDFDAVTRVHLRGTFTCARAAAIQMREQGSGGRLIPIFSPAGQRGSFGQSNYAAVKAGVWRWPAPGRWSWPGPGSRSKP